MAEDDSTMRGLLQTLLEIEGYEVKISDARGADIFELLRAFKPQFLILDYHLGNIKGIEILNELKIESNIHRPFILVTSGEDRRDQCLAAGADGFIIKPYMPDILISWLREREGSVDQ
ncbi:MAG TPA: response regulator [Anaerolineaceae bacterium]|nr:response regulator [Anaerolineaceae bacterium]